MDGDELATPGYAVLSPATRIKLATLDKGQLMIRHPHFTQPIFARFPRPAVMRGRDGADRYPPAPEMTLETAVARALRKLDPDITVGWVQETVGPHDEATVLRARDATIRTRPDDVKAFFRAQFRRIVPAEPTRAPATRGLRVPRGGNPYGDDEPPEEPPF
jgi:hypothetical protein